MLWMLLGAESSGGLMDLLESAGKSRCAAVKILVRLVRGCQGDESSQIIDPLQLSGELFLETTLVKCGHAVQDVVEFCEGYVECEVDDFEDNFEDVLLREQVCR